MLRTQFLDGFRQLVPNDKFHCQTPLKNSKFDSFGSEKSHVANLRLANCDSPTGYGMHFPAIQNKLRDSVHLSSVSTDDTFLFSSCKRADKLRKNNKRESGVPRTK